MGSPIFMGAELEDFRLTGAWEYAGGYSILDDGHSRRGSQIWNYGNNANAQAESPVFASPVTDACAMLHYSIHGAWSYPATSEAPFLGYASSGQRQVALQVNPADGKIKLVSWNGASYDTIATYATVLQDGISVRFDFAIADYGTANCRVRVWARYIVSYPGNSYNPPFLMFDETGDYGSTSDLDSLIVTCIWPDVTNWHSPFEEVVVHEDLTLRLRLATLTPNAAGSSTNWTGAYTDIDEIAANDSDAIESSTADAIFRCGLSDLPTATEGVLAVQSVGRASRGETGLANMQLGVYSGTSYDLSSDIALDVAIAGYQGDIIEVDPATSAAWTRAGVNALQWVVKART